MSTCDGTKADGEPCGSAPMDGSDYCRHHQPDDPDTPDRPDIVEAERKAVDGLVDLGESGRSESVRVSAWAEVLKHTRDSE